MIVERCGKLVVVVSMACMEELLQFKLTQVEVISLKLSDSTFQVLLNCSCPEPNW